MVGLIWFVQVAHYPLFAAIGRAEFPRYQVWNVRATSFVVGPLLAAEGASALGLLVLVGGTIVWTGSVLLALIWLSTAFRQDPGLADVCAAHGCPVVLMHRFDPPRQDAAAPTGRALVRAVAAALAERVAFAVDRGIDRNRIVLDPGVGFGTLSADNLAMHAFVDELRALDLPLLFGTSRKSFLGHVTGREVGDRLFATAASQACLALAGVEILRVHDVREMRDVVAIADAIRSAGRAP